MAIDPKLGDMNRAIEAAIKAHWRLLLIQGSVMIILGVAAIVVPVAATIALDIFIGYLFLISGLVGLVAVLSTRDIPAFFWSLITSALAVAVGVVLIWEPTRGALSLTLVLVALFVAEGVFQIATSMGYRHVTARSWGWMMVSGIADLLLAAVIIFGWPFTAIWALGLLVGINLLTSGWAIVIVALAGHGAANRDIAQPLRG